MPPWGISVATIDDAVSPEHGFVIAHVVSVAGAQPPRSNLDAYCCSAKCTLLHSSSASAQVPVTETMKVRCQDAQKTGSCNVGTHHDFTSDGQSPNREATGRPEL